MDKRPAEILTEVRVPRSLEKARGTYLKFVGNAAADWPILGVAALLQTGRGRVVKDLRVVLSCVSSTPLKVAGLGDLVFGQPLTEERMESIAASAAEQADPIEDGRGSAWYKREIVRVHVRRALEQLTNGSEASRVDAQGQAARPVEIHVNGERRIVFIKDNALLLDVLREQIDLAGPKEGCGVSACGTCTVLLDGEPVSTCLALVAHKSDRTRKSLQSKAYPPTGIRTRSGRPFTKSRPSSARFAPRA